jgi:hypothetical protein
MSTPGPLGTGGSTADEGAVGGTAGGARQQPNREDRGTPGLACELCGGAVLDRHCKVVCLNCGFQRDCSDP